MSMLVASQEHDQLKYALQICADDLPSPQVTEVEFLQRHRKWLQHDQSSLPDNAVKALAERQLLFFECDPLLRFGCLFVEDACEQCGIF